MTTLSPGKTGGDKKISMKPYDAMAVLRKLRRDSLQRATRYKAEALAMLDANNIPEAKNAALSALIFERDAKEKSGHISLQKKMLCNSKKRGCTQ